jgi:hypothetical protein
MQCVAGAMTAGARRPPGHARALIAAGVVAAGVIAPAAS